MKPTARGDIRIGRLSVSSDAILYLPKLQCLLAPKLVIRMKGLNREN
jgi:hypothetical protein